MLATTIALLYSTICLLWQFNNAIHLNDFISYYETLTYDHVTLRKRVKRGAGSAINLRIKTHGRAMHVTLHRDPDVLSPDAILEDGAGKLLQMNIASRAFVGRVRGEKSSYAHGTVGQDGVFEGKIFVGKDVFAIERSKRHFNKSTPFHSIIYSQKHVKLKPWRCKSDELYKQMRRQRLKRETNTDWLTQDRHVSRNYHIQPNQRQHRALDPSKTTCPLYIQFENKEDLVVEQLTQHVQGVNRIYKKIDFDKNQQADNIQFIIKRIKVHCDPNLPNYKYDGAYGVESFLELFSQDNYDSFCLAYMFTYRDFEGGTLGLAWTGDESNAGGVCERNGQFRGSLKSLNSGIVTILNYGKDVPSTISHVTMAHEIGHNMGSQHDPESTACSPGGTDGNYIMFSRATSGDKPNNNRFSTCSKKDMAKVMELKARHTSGCFIAAPVNICGNEVVEKNEECDCGWEEDCEDACCHPMSSNPKPGAIPCTRRRNAVCSVSEGPCCTETCQLVPSSARVRCRNATSCESAASCSGLSARCPPSVKKPDKTPCDRNLVCYKGECSGSICLAYGLQSCQCDPATHGDYKDAVLCQLCCKLPGPQQECRPSSKIPGMPQARVQPGAPCMNYKGYCDVYLKCREVDPSGPLNNLKKFLFSGEGLETIYQWLTHKWYIVVLVGVGLIIALVTVENAACTNLIHRPYL